MASAPLNWLLKIGGDALNTTAQTLSAAVNELKGLFSSVNNMGDVNISSPTDGQIMTYDGTDQEWKNAAPPESGMKVDGSNAANDVTFPKNFTVGARTPNETTGDYSTSFGQNNTVRGQYAHAEGYGHFIIGRAAHAEGDSCMAYGKCAHAEGYVSNANGDYTHAEGRSLAGPGECAHAEGMSHAEGNCAHAEGRNTTASGNYSHAEGYGNYNNNESVTASGEASHAEGRNTTASGEFSHAEGKSTTASGDGAHAEGINTTASGQYAHAEGAANTAFGNTSHAEGTGNTANGDMSHVGGRNITASRDYSFVHGNYVSSLYKFHSTAMAEKYGQAFGFDMSGEDFTADTAVTDAKQNGCQGCIENTATVTIELEPQGIYLLIANAFTISTGALYGATVNLITGHGLSSGAPTNTAIKATSNAPLTVGVVAGNKITLKNGAATRCAQFTLIRVA